MSEIIKEAFENIDPERETFMNELINKMENMNSLEEEAKDFAMTKSTSGQFINTHMRDFIAGANSKWVQVEKIKAKIEILNEIRGFHNSDNRFYIDDKIEQLEQQLKQFEDDNS